MIDLTDDEAAALRRLLRALGEARDEFVVTGGQAARLFRLHPLASPPTWPALRTADIDVATSDRGHRARIDLGAALLREGFTPEMTGDDSPPLTHYTLGASEIELIVPDLPRRRAGGATVEVLGASAQKVADLQPLLVDPFDLEVEGIGLVRLPNPGAYLLQKAITLSARRTLEKKGKDALYVHDVLLLFTHDGRLRREVIEQATRVRRTLTHSQAKRLGDNARKLGESTTDFVAEAARQASDRARAPTAQSMATANRLGLQELLASS